MTNSELEQLESRAGHLLKSVRRTGWEIPPGPERDRELVKRNTKLVKTLRALVMAQAAKIYALERESEQRTLCGEAVRMTANDLLERVWEQSKRIAAQNAHIELLQTLYFTREETPNAEVP